MTRHVPQRPIQFHRFALSGHCHRVELLLSLLELAGPYLTQQAIDRYIAPKRVDGYQWLAILWFLVLIATVRSPYSSVGIASARSCAWCAPASAADTART